MTRPMFHPFYNPNTFPNIAWSTGHHRPTYSAIDTTAITATIDVVVTIYIVLDSPLLSLEGDYLLDKCAPYVMLRIEGGFIGSYKIIPPKTPHFLCENARVIY